MRKMVTQKEVETIVNDLYLFYRFFVGSKFKENLHAPHIKHISKSLMKQYLGDEDYSRLCISTPPRHSKSSLVTIAYPLWLFFRNPSVNIIVINASFSLSEKFGIQIRQYIKEYGALFGVKLSQAKQSSTVIMVENMDGELQTGSIRLLGYNAQLTGMDADYIIIDDYIKNVEDLTPSALDKAYEWFKAVLLQRLEPHTKLIIMATRWSSNDIQGKVKKYFPEEYKFLSYPAILPNGEPLWKQRYRIKELEKKREQVGERMFQALYMQNPLDETSDFFTIPKIRIWTKKELEESGLVSRAYCRAWDIASAVDVKSDYTAGALLSVLSDNKTVVIHDMVHGKFGNDNLNIIRKTAAGDPSGTMTCIETGVGAAGNLLYEEWAGAVGGNVMQLKPINSKVDRATPLKRAILDGNIVICVEDEETRLKILDEMKAFPLGEHDDQVDAISYAYNYLYQNYIRNNTLLGIVNI